MDEKKYTIKELCDLTGFPLRTIRYYIQEGLLEPPAGRGRGGFYFDSHLKQLLKIKSLQEQGLKLSSIISYLQKGKIEALPSTREVWIKHEILPGLEINVRRDLEENKGKMVLEVLRIVKTLAKEDEKENGK